MAHVALEVLLGEKFHAAELLEDTVDRRLGKRLLTEYFTFIPD
jgi:hypothetical protein